MKSISYTEFRKFLDSDVDEAEYFGCNKDNLISMKKYLVNLSNRFELCENKIKYDRESIKKKYKQIDLIIYSKDIRSVVVSMGKTYFSLIRDSKTGFYIPEDIFSGEEIYLYKKLKLLLIERIGKQFSKELSHIKNETQKYFAKNNIIESVSGTFGLEDFYNGATLFCGNYELFDIEKRTYIPYEYTFEQFANYYKEKSELSIEDKQKLLTKIMVPRGFLN